MARPGLTTHAGNLCAAFPEAKVIGRPGGFLRGHLPRRCGAEKPRRTSGSWAAPVVCGLSAALAVPAAAAAPMATHEMTTLRGTMVQAKRFSEGEARRRVRVRLRPATATATITGPGGVIFEGAMPEGDIATETQRFIHHASAKG